MAIPELLIKLAIHSSSICNKFLVTDFSLVGFWFLEPNFLLVEITVNTTQYFDA